MPDEKATAYLMEMLPELRGCAFLDKKGNLLASTDDGARWQQAAGEVVDAVDSVSGERASHAHIATGDGEVFMVRENDRVAVAVTERFTLASLVLFDLRAVLRDQIEQLQG